MGSPLHATINPCPATHPHAQPTFPLRCERLFAVATESPPTKCSSTTRRGCVQTADRGSPLQHFGFRHSHVVFDCLGSNQATGSGALSPIIPRPHWFESSRPDRGRTYRYGRVPSSRSRGVTRRGHIFRFADHVGLGPLTALIVGCALGRMSAIVHD
jgi:hypothetical protein